MIMKTSVSVTEFRFVSVGLLCGAYIVQLILIVLFVYGGNWLFFKIHKPEKCCVITVSQKSLDEIAYAIGRFKKQYEIRDVLDYRDPNLKEHIKHAETVFAYDVPVERRTEILRMCYKYK